MSEKFSELVKRAFSFLEAAGFVLTERHENLLRYESERTVVFIGRDPRLGEIDVAFELKGSKNPTFSLTDLLRMEDADVPERKAPFQVYDEADLSPFVGQLAKDTELYAKQALAGDRMYFRRLETFRSGKSLIDAKDMEIGRIRTQAGEAWQKRELDKVIALYVSIENELTAAEKMRLIYARDNLAK